MNYTKKIYSDKAVEVQIASFVGQGGTVEYQLILSLTDSRLPFVDQLQNLLWVYAAVVKNELADGATALFRRYFLSDATNQADSVMEWECENAFCPLSVVQQPPLNGTKIAMWVYLRTNTQVQTYEPGLLVASCNGYRHLWTGGSVSRAENSEFQTRLLLNDYVVQLMGQGCTLAANCIRTWFFVQNVDVNYAGVVKARKEVFMTQNLTEKTHYIASTGIEGRHADPSVLVQMDGYAIQGLASEQIQYLYGATHLNPTNEYGVTFERGTAVTYGDRKHVFISGTASINNSGEVVHPGNIIKQTERMMENIHVLLAEAGASVNDIVQSVTYLRDVADYDVVKTYLENQYPHLPHLIVLAPVCRPGWLIETECIAVIPAASKFKPL